MLNGKQAVCDRDCFHCKFEDCIEDGMNHADYVQQSVIEKELLFPKTAKQKKIAAGQKAYYEANREKIAAGQKAYYEANREKIAAGQKAYREANREKIAAGQKAYREANREKYNRYMREYMSKRRQAEVSRC